MERYICIHGHFYQPPRENPWLEAIEVQDSAYPYHDWNERVAAECYAPNGASRIMDAEGHIRQIVNNYLKISFNFGPTLLTWMERDCPDAYRNVLAADRESHERFSGHGSAMAQAYNHVIMPLANSRDKRTQIIWGIRDFEHRFGRKPEGMWLPETGVDLETLDILAGAGIKFTVLAPHQASRVRPSGGRAWKDVTGARIDPTVPYQIKVSDRRTMALFFYDGPISRAVAFEDLLERGENLANRLYGAFSDFRDRSQLVHIATDGETYGHHRQHADMALAYALHYIESSGHTRLTNYGEFLEKHPPLHEVQIIEDSSWSCVHGVERWRSNCGCNSGMHHDWHQNWRAPLRHAFDWLRDRLAVSFEEAGNALLRDPWRARDAYISVVLERTPETLNTFFQKQARRALKPAERVQALKLLELQRHAMLMYTSCGWFFDELSGTETVQSIQYAGRALQLGQEIFGDGLEEGFLELLENTQGNLPEHRDGRTIYEKFVRPAMVNLEKAGAHYAISSMFEDYPPHSNIYSYSVDREDLETSQEGKARLMLGRAKITSRITEESQTLSFGVLHLGGQNVSGGVREYRGAEAYGMLAHEINAIFHRGDIPDLVRAVDRHFGVGTYSLRLLFRDEQRKIVGQVLDQALVEADALYRSFYSHYATLARFITDLGIPLPSRFQMAVDFTLHEDLMAALKAVDPDPRDVQSLLEQVRRIGILLDNVTLEFAYRKTVERAARAFLESPHDVKLLERFDRAVSVCPLLPFTVLLWDAQNSYHTCREAHFAEMSVRAARGDTDAQVWLHTMDALGGKLGFYVPREKVVAG